MLEEVESIEREGGTTKHQNGGGDSDVTVALGAAWDPREGGRERERESTGLTADWTWCTQCWAAAATYVPVNLL